MFRRVVSLAVMPCVLLSQSAALGHSHGGREPAGHGIRRHFHTNPVSIAHDHGHHHHDRTSHDHDHDKGASASEFGDPRTQQPAPLTRDDHDSDAIFVDCVDVIINSFAAIDNGLGAFLIPSDAGWYLPTGYWTTGTCAVVDQTHGPPTSGYACPLYLRQLTLLI
jgi:hypothetical protein